MNHWDHWCSCRKKFKTTPKRTLETHLAMQSKFPLKKTTGPPSRAVQYLTHLHVWEKLWQLYCFVVVPFRCWGDPQNTLSLILFYLGKPTGLGECILAKITAFQNLWIFLKKPWHFFYHFGDSQNVELRLPKQYQRFWHQRVPTHFMSGGFSKIRHLCDMFFKTNRKQIYLSGFGSAFPDEGRGGGFWRKNETQLIT